MLPPDAQPLPNLHAAPSEVAQNWPVDIPMVALIGNNGHARWSRWSVIAHADGERCTLNDGDAIETFWETLLRKGNSTLLPNWIGFFGYELGYCLEPKSGSMPESEWPLADFVWCDKALIHDAETNAWWSIGNCTVPEINEVPQKPAWDNIQSTSSNSTFADAVDKTVSYIHDGDIFQANITRRFSSSAQGNLRSAALHMLGNPGGWYGAWLEYPDDGRYVLSMSPELFLQYDESSGEIVTRPMKGTRREEEDPSTLLRSEKDAAELHMIVDLMRNDLGRVCEIGTIHVAESRAIEKHPTVWQCVGEIHGKVSSNVTLKEVIEATFPPGSVTGAPKIRAMQIIQEIEDSPRGPYCGAIGVVGKIAMLNVAIRTGLFTGEGTPNDFRGALEYSTGCGIIADSNSTDETDESEVKTHIVRTHRASN